MQRPVLALRAVAALQAAGRAAVRRPQAWIRAERSLFGECRQHVSFTYPVSSCIILYQSLYHLVSMHGFAHRVRPVMDCLFSGYFRYKKIQTDTNRYNTVAPYIHSDSYRRISIQRIQASFFLIRKVSYRPLRVVFTVATHIYMQPHIYIQIQRIRLYHSVIQGSLVSAVTRGLHTAACTYVI